MASLKLLVSGASAIGASALTSYLLMSDNTVSIVNHYLGIINLYLVLYFFCDIFFIKTSHAINTKNFLLNVNCKITFKKNGNKYNIVDLLDFFYVCIIYDIF